MHLPTWAPSKARVPGTPALNMLRVERRYLFDDARAFSDLLRSKGTVTSYSSVTQYVDTAAGTWSIDPTLPRFRLRQYSSGDQFMETKLSLGKNIYAKSRRRVDSLPDGLVSLGKSIYMRLEFQRGDLRVTVDVGLTDGKRTFKQAIVEVKTPIGAKVPDWLKAVLPQPSNFSKWRWINR